MTQVIRTVLEVDASKAVAGFDRGEKAVHGYARALDDVSRVEGGRRRNSVFDDVPDSAARAESSLTRLSGSIRDNRAEWDRISSQAMLGGAAIAGGLALATKASIGWESAWAGVTKTVDGTPEQMAELEAGLRGLAKELPATHEELAGVAEAAGQLGVAREDILGFTRVAVDLGESTNLSAEEAAESLAKMSNIMGTAARDGVEGYERMGAALVALGNDGASTEKDIMAMSLRLAGAGKQIGATEADILAMSNALSSVGIEAELGGGAMSRAMLKMNTAVISGGKQLDAFAKIAGVSAQEFATKWREDPIAATNDFISGLGRIGESGGDASAALSEVGLAGTQNAQVLLRAAGASDLVTESLELGKQAWKDNAALQEEAAKRYETTESKLKIARNSIKDAAIDVGSVFGPMLATGAEKVADLANAFVQLPGPVKATVTGIAGVTGATLLVGGATVKAVGAMQDFKGRLEEIGMLTPRVEKGLNGAAAGAKVLGLTLAAMSIGGALGSAAQGWTQGEYALESLNKRMLEGENAVSVWSDAIRESAGVTGTVEPGIRSFDDAMRVALDPSYMNKGADAMSGLAKVLTLGMGDFETASDQAQRAFAGIDEQLTTLVSSGHAEEAARQFAQYEEHFKAAGKSTDDLKGLLPGYVEAVASAGNESKLTGDDLSSMGDAAAEAEESVDDLAKSIKGLGSTFLDERQSARDYQQSLEDMKKSIEENGRAWGTATPEGRANQEALEGIAKAARDSAAAVIENGGSVEEANQKLRQGRKDVDEWAKQLNVGKGEVKQLKDELLTMPEDAVTEVDAKTEGAEQKARDFKNTITGIDGMRAEATVEESGAIEARDRVIDFRDTIFGITGKDVEVTEHGATDAKSRVLGFNEKIVDLTGKTVTVTEVGAASARGRVDELRKGIAVIDGKTVTVTEVGATAAGDRVVRFKDRIYAVPTSRDTRMQANVHGLWDVDNLRNSINQTHDKTVTVTYRQVTEHFTRIFSASGNMFEQGVGGLGLAFADGGIASIGSQQPQIRAAGGVGITWAEDGAGPWEAFISGHPAKKPRSRMIAEDTVGRLGGEVVWRYADGGIHEGRHYVAPQPRPVAAAASATSAPAVARLHPDDAALLRAVAERPVRVEMDRQTLATSVRRANDERRGRGL